MSSIRQHPLPEAAKSHAEGQLSLWANLNGSLLAGAAELAELNMQAARTSVNDAMQWLHDLQAARNMQDFLALSARQIQPNIDRLAAYSRQMADIAAGLRTNMLETAHGKVNETHRQNALVMEGLFKLPDGDANPLAGWMKNALDAANASYGQLLGASMQMARSMDGHSGAPQPQAAPREKPNGRTRKK